MLLAFWKGQGNCVIIEWLSLRTIKMLKNQFGLLTAISFNFNDFIISQLTLHLEFIPCIRWQQQVCKDSSQWCCPLLTLFTIELFFFFRDLWCILYINELYLIIDLFSLQPISDLVINKSQPNSNLYFLNDPWAKNGFYIIKWLGKKTCKNHHKKIKHCNSLLHIKLYKLLIWL